MSATHCGKTLRREAQGPQINTSHAAFMPENRVARVKRQQIASRRAVTSPPLRERLRTPA